MANKHAQEAMGTERQTTGEGAGEKHGKRMEGHRMAKIRERQGGANVATEMGGQEVGSTCDDKGWENGGSNLLYEEW